MTVSTQLKLLAKDRLHLVYEKHRRGVELISEALDEVGGEIGPQKALVPILEPRFRAAGFCRDSEFDEKMLTEFVRKYESTGFFYRETMPEKRSANVLKLTALGEALVAVLKTGAAERWVARTLWRVETLLRMKRSLVPKTQLSLDQFIDDVLRVAPALGLPKLARRESAEHLVRTALAERFGKDEIQLNDEDRTLTVLRSLR